jgi:transposase
VSLVARRHDLNTNLLFSWRRRLRGRRAAGAVGFVPAVIAPPGDRVVEVRQEPSPDLSSGGLARPTGRIEIVLGEPRRLIVEEDVSASALARVISALEGR